MPNIKLPDGSIRSFEQPVTISEVAASIGAGLARAALAGKVNGKLVDTSFCIDEDVDLAIITDKDADGLDTVSYTHLRAHETVLDLVCRLLLAKHKNTRTSSLANMVNKHSHE